MCEEGLGRRHRLSAGGDPVLHQGEAPGAKGVPQRMPVRKREPRSQNRKETGSAKTRTSLRAGFSQSVSITARVADALTPA